MPGLASSECLVDLSRLGRHPGQILALQRRHSAGRPAQVEACAGSSGCNFSVTKHAQHGFAISGGRVDVPLNRGVERRFGRCMRGLPVQLRRGRTDCEQDGNR
jgi:hypothetical protein